MSVLKFKPTSFTWQHIGRKIADFVRSSRKYLTFPVPVSSGQVYNLSVGDAETIVNFNGDIAQPITFNIDAGPALIIGDKVLFFVKASGSSRVVTFSDNVFTNVSSNPGGHTFTAVTTDTKIVTLIFDGTNFHGIDYF